MEIRPFHKLTSIMDTKKEWFVMRDLHRGHRAVLSYQDLANKGYETYTPTVKSLSKDKGGKTVVSAVKKGKLAAYEIHNRIGG